MNRKPERLPTPPNNEVEKKDFDQKKVKWSKVTKKQGCPKLVIKIIKKFFGL